MIEVYNFLDAAATGQQDEPCFAEALAITHVQQAIMRFWDNGVWEKVESPG